MKMKLSIVAMSIFYILITGTAFAVDNVYNNIDLTDEFNQNVNCSLEENKIIEENNDIVSITDSTTFSTDRVLWDQVYTNESSIKKNINEKNYGFYAKPGKVNVYIKNTGKTTINVNIYKSWWNSTTIDSGSVAPGTSRTFVIGPEHGGYDCTTNNCFAFQKFTISTYSNSGKISFYGRARIYY